MSNVLQSLGIDPAYILISVIGFACLVWVLVKYAFGPVVVVLNARQDKIVADLDEAKARRDEMVALQGEYSDRLGKIEEEARDKIQVAIKEANVARDQILHRAHEEAAAIAERGRQEIDSERAKALVGARDQIVDLASAMASRTVQESLSAAGQVRIIDDVIKGIATSSSLN